MSGCWAPFRPVKPGECRQCDAEFEELLESVWDERLRQQEQRKLSDLEHRCGVDDKD